MRAVVFAYHDVGERCLRVLLAHGIEVVLVVTHEDDPAESRWFASVAEAAALRELPVILPADPNAPEIVARIAALQPDFLFSFYYRQMLGEPLLGCVRCGAYNLHGSLLPQYRGRAPVNWAVLHGEHRTGATLHRMVAKPDAGEIVGQQAVPILPDDTAFEVMRKVTVAAEMVLDAFLPALIAGQAVHTPQPLEQGRYFGGRKPEDGRIDWHRPAWAVHNLIRAVAPPYPGAFCEIDGHRLDIGGSLLLPTISAAKVRAEAPRVTKGAPAATLHLAGDTPYAVFSDGHVLRLLKVSLDGTPIERSCLARQLRQQSLPLGNSVPVPGIHG